MNDDSRLPVFLSQELVVVISMLFFLAYSTTIVCAGHGIGLVGMLLVMGSFSAWGLPMALGWLGGALLIIDGVAFHRRIWPLLALGSTASVLVSDCLFYVQSENAHYYLGWMWIPVIAVAALTIVRFAQILTRCCSRKPEN